MNTGDRYRRPISRGRAERHEKKSRFLAEVRPAINEPAALLAIEQAREKYRDASHVCWAMRTGFPPRERSFDAGEPAGTAGAPMLRVLAGANLSDVVVVVVRWFGGTKLGKGGLARAYAQAVKDAIDGLRAEEWAPSRRWQLDLPYSAEGGVQRLLQSPQVKLLHSRFGERVQLEVEVFESAAAEMQEALLGLGCRVSELAEAARS